MQSLKIHLDVGLLDAMTDLTWHFFYLLDKLRGEKGSSCYRCGLKCYRISKVGVRKDGQSVVGWKTWSSIGFRAAE